MDLPTLTNFFMWCTIIDAGLLLLVGLILAFAQDLVYRFHGRWFAISRESFNLAMYQFLGYYKLALIFFNLVPWLVLLIIA